MSKCRRVRSVTCRQSPSSVTPRNGLVRVLRHRQAAADSPRQWANPRLNPRFDPCSLICACAAGVEYGAAVPADSKLRGYWHTRLISPWHPARLLGHLGYFDAHMQRVLQPIESAHETPANSSVFCPICGFTLSFAASSATMPFASTPRRSTTGASWH